MTYISRHKPWKHQREALASMKDKPAYALLMAMRTGKTKTLLDDWGRLEQSRQCQDLMVIAPGGVYRTWEQAIKDHLNQDLLNQTSIYTWSAQDRNKSAMKRVEEIFMKARTPRILLMNVEALSAVVDARRLAANFLAERDCMLAIDESTSIKNHRSKRTKFINNQLRPLAKYRRILTGLVAPKSPLDLYSQFEFLDRSILGYKTFTEFRNRYAIVENVRFPGHRFPVPIVKKFQNLDELQAKIGIHSTRVLLEDCYDLPPKMYSIREVPLTKEQQRIYNEIKEFATSQLTNGEHVTATQVITQILRMHQVLCGHVRTENGELQEITEYRTDTLLELLQEHEGKGIIWCSYDADVRKVSRALIEVFGEDVVARFWGGNRSTRELEEQRFRNDPACRYMVATAAAGGRGRTWTEADLVVYYSNTADLEHRSQSEERAQGVDKTRSVAYVDLVAPGTVDEKMIRTLRAKISMAAVINGDNWREWLI